MENPSILYGYSVLCPTPSGAAKHLAAEWPIHCFLCFTSAYQIFASYFIPLTASGLKVGCRLFSFCS